MYHMYILKSNQLPDLIHDYVILEVNLVPQDGCNYFQNSEIRVCLENWHINIYHMQLIKIDQLPDLIHDHVDLRVHLESEIRVCLEKLTYKHISYADNKGWSTPWPNPWPCWSRSTPRMVLQAPKTIKFGFPLTN